MILTDILNELGYNIDHKGIRVIIEKTLRENGIDGDTEVAVNVIGEKEMRQLHKKYMKTEEVTDVLSFPMHEDLIKQDIPAVDPDGVLRLGDIVVCYPQAARQAVENNREVKTEVEFLVEHGCRHLLGIHHD
jgi:probable rRNA maturation factor